MKNTDNKPHAWDGWTNANLIMHAREYATLWRVVQYGCDILEGFEDHLHWSHHWEQKVGFGKITKNIFAKGWCMYFCTHYDDPPATRARRGDLLEYACRMGAITVKQALEFPPDNPNRFLNHPGRYYVGGGKWRILHENLPIFLATDGGKNVDCRRPSRGGSIMDGWEGWPVAA